MTKEQKFDVDRDDLYSYDKPKENTKKRLLQIAEMGMEEVGVAEFGVPGVMSGLYIERVWNYSDQQWNEYMEWAESLIKSKT